MLLLAFTWTNWWTRRVTSLRLRPLDFELGLHRRFERATVTQQVRSPDESAISWGIELTGCAAPARKRRGGL
jgi:hypothetical protein